MTLMSRSLMHLTGAPAVQRVRQAAKDLAIALLTRYAPFRCVRIVGAAQQLDVSLNESSQPVCLSLCPSVD